VPVGSILRFQTRAARDRYLSSLRSIYGSGVLDIPDPDYALEQDPEIYDKMRRDPVIATALDWRVKSVVGSTWHLDPASDSPTDKDAATIFEEILKGLRNFLPSRAAVFESAYLKGSGYGWLRGRRVPSATLDGRPVRGPWLPSEIEDANKLRFHFAPHRDEATGAISQRMLYSPMSEPAKGRRDDTVSGVFPSVSLTPAEERALVRLVFRDREERLGQGEGVGPTLFHWFRQKALAWRDWAQAGERWAQGVVAMKIDQDREGSQTNEDIADAALDQIDAMRSRHALVYGEGEEVQLFETSGTGQQISASQIEKIDQDIIRLFTGGIRAMGGDTKTGARAQGEVEQDTGDVLISYDRAVLDECLTETLLRCVWELNRGVVSQLGLSGAKMPRFVSEPENRTDPVKIVPVVTAALSAGIPLRKVDVYEALGFQAPSAEDEVFEGMSQLAGFGGLPGAGGGSIADEMDGTEGE